MKAWQFTAVGKPLELVELDDPRPGPGQVVIDVQAAGLCHTDISFMDGHVPGMPTHLPIVLGHEVAGTIIELGESVDGFAVGDRVGISPVGGLDGPGVGRDGGYGERVIGLVEELVPVPDNVSFAQAAAGTDAGSTSHHAVKVAGGVEGGSRVGIIGLGGLGQVGARIAVLLGAEVYGVDIRPEQAEVASELGLSAFFTATTELAPLELDVIIDFAGVDTTGDAIAAVRPGGRVVQIGAGKPDATISLIQLVTRDITLVGTLGGGKDDTTAVYDMLASGGLQPQISTLPFHSIAEGIETLRAGQVAGRSVAVRG